ncbi:5-oxoprolinase subunit B family protein, partial [Mycobacterium sp. NPDC003449]
WSACVSVHTPAHGLPIRRAGERAWLVECPAGCSAGLAAGIAAGPNAHLVRDIVPAATTVLVVARRRADLGVLREQLRTLSALPDTGTGTDSRLIRVPTVYDGADLDAVAAATGLTREQVITLHSETVYTVAFFGFAPGFAYLTGLSDRLRVNRRPAPRPKVPAGSVAIANLQTCIYPGAMPSGWNQVGSADVELWDVTATPPSRLRIGDRVRFERVAR